MARSELVQANIDRARATSAPVKSPVAATATDAAKAKENKKGPRVSDHKSILGANLSILQTLASIEFAPGNDGGMYKTTAYIELWKRQGTKSTQQEVGVDLGTEVVAYPNISNDFLKSSFNTAVFDLNSPTFTLGKDFKFGTDYGATFTNTSTVPSGNPTKPQTNTQTAISQAVPSTVPPGVVPNPVTGAPVDADPKPTPAAPVSGPIKPANPGGGVAGASRKTLGYGGNLTQTVNGSGRIGDFCTEKPQGVWQFLFNPEEIDWEGGPEYDEAQTWGVMGKTNSGKPLFWKNMKNERLTFSKVLLNGYVFGKQVGSLEEGLKDLFYKEDGDNPTGPPVLNLIWGERTFGPCVIQDVRVKEKNWDNGILVNAEVSFSLVRIPEWIVNDGYVDVARPSAQPINADVFAAPGKADAPPGGGGDAPPGGDKPGPQAGSNAGAAVCKKEKSYLTSLNTLLSELTKIKPVSLTTVNNYISSYIRNESLYTGFYLKLLKDTRYTTAIQNMETSCNLIKIREYRRFLDDSKVQFDKDAALYSYGSNNYKELYDVISRRVNAGVLNLKKCNKVLNDIVTKKYNDDGCKKYEPVSPASSASTRIIAD